MEIARLHARWAPVDDRVREVLENIRRDCGELDPKARNESNEHQVERFITWLEGQFPGRGFQVRRGERGNPVSADDEMVWETARRRTDRPCVVIERQRLAAWAVRTTRWNYLFTVPGDSTDTMVLVAHYDTWRGPGADDNTTGEEIVKQYLLADLRAERRPPITHTYFLAGSEECGLVGLTSQVFLALGMQAANVGLTQPNWHFLVAALATVPLATYRFGVSGSREYVRTLTDTELRRLRAVVSVDSVGEGRLYIPRGTMGADFVHVLVPFDDYDSLNDVLEEGAHLHGIPYNNFLAGGTTDHVSFLEVNNGLLERARDAVRRVLARIAGRPYVAPLRVPATALVAMSPGKASPIVFGGKIHTKNDTPDRVFPQPLRETLLILDYLFHRLDGGERVGQPRHADQFHYARLYRSGAGYLVALKDAVEPNYRNVNAVYRATVERTNGLAVARLGEMIGWGVDTRLDEDVAETCASLGVPWSRDHVAELVVEAEGTRLRFARRPLFPERLARYWHGAVAGLQRVVRGGIFLTFFALAWLLAQLIGWGFDRAFDAWPRFALWVAGHIALTGILVIAAELVILLYLMARRIPTWIDNGYKHENKGDNQGSLRRVSV